MTAFNSPRTTLREEDGKGVVRIDDLFATSAEDLWAALTDPARLTRWIAIVTGELKLGGAFTATFTSGWRGPGRIEACEPPRRLLLAMAEGTADASTIEALLTPVNGSTRLVIEERGFPLDELPFHSAGWQVHVEDLGTHLAGGEPEPWEPRWKALLPRVQKEWTERGR